MSDGYLMGLGACTCLDDRFGLRAKAQSWLPSSCYREKAVSTCQQDLGPSLRIGQYLNGMEEYVCLCRWPFSATTTHSISMTSSLG